jgi:hypothetical protein
VFEQVLIRDGRLEVKVSALDHFAEFFDCVKILKERVEIAGIPELLQTSREFLRYNDRGLAG